LSQNDNITSPVKQLFAAEKRTFGKNSRMVRREFMSTATYSMMGLAFKGPGAHNDKHQQLQLRTPLCDYLGIKYPVIQAGMTDISGPELAASVSNAGGLGILAATMLPPDELRKQIRKLRSLTSRPFGVNLLLQNQMLIPRRYDTSTAEFSHVKGFLDDVRAELDIAIPENVPDILPPFIALACEIILEEEVPVFSIGLGIPSAYLVGRCKEKGVKIMAMACTVEDAIRLEQAGVDVIVAQGSEAGGHRSTWIKKSSAQQAAIGTLSLVSQVADTVRVPVIAAGGITTGEQVVSTILLGAQAVMMGTAFIPVEESNAPAFYKQKICECSSDDTVITDVFTGMYARVLRNRFVERYTSAVVPILPPGIQYMMAQDIFKAAKKRELHGYYPLYCGQGAGKLQGGKTAKELIDLIVQQAVDCLKTKLYADTLA
jgi:nitronate monooxygenase